MAPGDTSIESALARATARLAATPAPVAERATCRRDAELLLRHATGLSRAELLAHPERPLTPVEAAAFLEAVERRARSEPIQYITGVQEFYGLEFHVGPAVLIPRPETEHLVEAALEFSRKWAGRAKIADIGTGAGTIAVTLAKLLPTASLLATDISRAALEIAAENALYHRVENQIAFLECDLLPEGAAGFDLICSNAPYIPDGEVLEPQVAEFEPHSALFAGVDGLDVYRRLVPLAAHALQPRGAMLLEIGHGQKEAMETLLNSARMRAIHFIADLQGISRIAVAQK